ncbi:acetyl-CoA synthetase-like protein [Aspergillus heteromorphus CBS 117.55]|uniref:Acetyl-CoA synthetase-like protein n=1 Tax=Aspergillus heteromorphus CBS 117.55 TaxID=1448321 RepID=A0A317V3F2_9EURO|nr:acetyl-CoA synthetase-like protein [Aspergillus heteromorphus CBS 117.55]PWY66710.1 acetyl-CoA synthetase-like protein [Aspergillus heteromorphus CBS 117.55]
MSPLTLTLTLTPSSSGQCHFPTEHLAPSADADAAAASPAFKSISVAHTPSNTQAAPLSLSLSHILQAWAVVLRYYTGSDAISFGRVDDTEQSATGSRFAVCQGEITADTALDELRASETSPSEASQGRTQTETQLLSDWVASNRSFNTLVWKTSLQTPPPVDELEGSHISLALLVIDSAQPRVTLLYAPHSIGDIIAAAAAEAMVKAMDAIANAPHTPIGSLDLFGPSSRERIEEWNAAVPPTVGACLHEQIDETARWRPAQTALECWDGSVTYAELADYSSRLGRVLVSQGVGPEVFVPVCFDKSLWAVVAMLGVLKAGGAFVCIDPAQPMDRLRAIIGEVQAQVALAAPEYEGLMAGEGVATVIAVDGGFIAALPPCHGQDLPRRATPRDAAFAIFTSGSTGKPKGIVHEHQAVCSSAREHSHRMNMDSGTRSFQFAAYTFIVNTFELFTPLVVGGCVCVPSKEDRLARTTGAMRDLRANWACLTPSFLRSISPEDIPDVKTLLLAGEPVQQDNLDTWRSRVRLLNMYGASEASVCVTGDLSGPVERTTIGRGTGVCAWVVDVADHNRLAPIGATGELAVEGPVLARGYINQPDKTAAAFVSHTPWLDDIRGVSSAARAYKTGDLVRLGSDGRINLVGRKDMQIKLRGQRIELEEVEFHIRQGLPGGTEVIVGLVKPVDQPDRPLLAAFVALRKGFGDDFHDVDAESARILDTMTADWKRKLAASVPGYMVPSTLVQLHYMPVIASGKLNRKAVNEYASRRTVAELTGAKGKAHREPSTDTGRALRTVWAEVLQRAEESISADDDFLELGGNSIDVMRLVNRCRAHGIGLSAAEVFTHPVLEGMAEASSTPDDQAPFEDTPFSLLGRDRDGLVEAAATQCHVAPSAIEDLYPCTAMQEGLLALSDSRSGVYTAQHTLVLDATIDLGRFKRACQEVADAHPILRTRIVYPERGAAALQAVIRGDLDWHSADGLARYMAEDKQRAMGPGDALTRYGIVPNGEGWMFVWTAHHAVYDAWTLELVFDRIDRAYRGQAMGKDASFKAFMRYVVSTDRDAADSFWREYLAGATATEFPCTVSTAKMPVSDATIRHDMALDPSQRLPGITMPSVIRAAWGILVGSHSGSDDVVFGTIVSGRNAPVPGVDRLVGPGIAAVPVRVNAPEGGQTVREFLTTVQSQSTRMIAFEQTGLQNISKVSADAACACDFQTLLVVQPARAQPAAATEAPDLRAVSDADANFGTYALTLECSLRPHGVGFAAHFDSTLISGDYVQRILGQLEHLLRQLCGCADGRLDELSFISPQDEESIRSWNQAIPAPVNQTVHQLIGERMAERPSHEAVCSWDGSFTYAELDRHSARLARRLAALDVRPESFVPCCFEKSRWPVVAMLGVLRSGGAFLNLDPSQPPSRMRLMITKLRSTTLVCSPQQYDLCRSLGPGYNIVVLSADTPEESTVGLPPSGVTPDHAAYVIFTSGSTGEPKGTVVQHGAYCSGSVTHAPTMLMDGRTRALQFASFTFDASLVEILTTLVVGGCVCIASEEQRRRDVTEAVRQTNANWAALTPSFVNLIRPDDVPSLETLVLAGEAMGQSHIDTWARRVRLVNAYGPSECCVCSTANSHVTSASSPRDIGLACSGAAWVVMPHDHHRLAPVGGVGELVMEGWNVGRGYLDEPAKTRAAFVPNPLWLSQGDATRPPSSTRRAICLSFQRRKDTQVKLRGQRIELGEIEYRLKQSLPGQPDAVVDILCPRDAAGQPRLVAFLPVAGAAPVSDAHALIPRPHDRHVAAVSGLEARLAEFLPMHMIPSAYLPVTHVPKLPSGKADRRTLIRCGGALTHREMAQYAGGADEVRPATSAMQLALQRLWGEALKTPAEHIGLDDHFLRLGGDSITAMRLASAARAQGIPLSTATVFQHPTLTAMSAVAETLALQQRPQTFEPFSSLPAIPQDELLAQIVLPQVDTPRANIADVLESTDFQALAIGGGLEPTRGWSNYLVFDFRGPIDLRRLRQACDALLAHHAILRTVFVGAGAQLLQVVLRSLRPEYAVHVQDDPGQDPSEALVRADLARPPRLVAPIVRFTLIKNGATRHRLLMRISHAQYDGASMPHLLHDLRAAYRGDPLPPRPQFATFVRMQLHSLDASSSLAFYRHLLANSTMTSLISHPSPSTPTVLDTMIGATVPLLTYKSHGITAATVIKAAWALTLAELSASADIVYGHMVSGRNLPLDDVESVMGPCLNIVPVRATLEPTTTTTTLDLLRALQQQQTETMPHESLGFRQIIDRCTDWPAHTRFSSVFQYQEFGADAAADPTQPVHIEHGLTCSPGFICPSPDACDLSLLATPVGGQVRVEMIYSRQAMSGEFAGDVLSRFCAVVAGIEADGVDGRVPGPEELRGREAVIPLPQPHIPLPIQIQIPHHPDPPSSPSTPNDLSPWMVKYPSPSTANPVRRAPAGAAAFAVKPIGAFA